MIVTNMPVFVFGRRRDIELKTGLILAGQLIVDIPKHTKPKKRDRQMIVAIVQKLTATARAGEMRDDEIVYGWPNGRCPDNADEIMNNDALMASWAKTRIVIAVRVDARSDAKIRLDSDMVREVTGWPR
jgi:hypothetical protein